MPVAGLAIKAGGARDDGLAIIALPLAVITVLWTLVPFLVHTAPPLDVVESALWGREWVIGTYKHPAMPAWIFEASRMFNGGALGWPADIAAQLVNVSTLLLTYAFARDLAGSRVAAAAVLALLGVEYFSWRSPELNHTQAQMPLWIGSAWAAWRAVETRSLGWWLALGAMAAAGLYGKLSNATLLIVIAAWILATPRGRAQLATAGPFAGAAVFALLCVPLARWLLASNFQALAYAGARGREQTLVATLLFPVNMLFQAAPIALALAVAGLFQRASPPHHDKPALGPDGRSFLFTMTLAPPLLAIVLALLGGSGLRASWLAPSLPLAATLVVATWSHALDDGVLARLRTIGLGIAVLVPLGYALIVPNLSRLSSAPLLRVNWPQADIAKSLADVWKEATPMPLRIVAGQAWPAGLVALNHPDRPSILTDGELSYAPWITPQRLARDGALIVWSETPSAGLTHALATLIAGRPVHESRIPAPRGKPGAAIVIKSVVLPPN